MNVRETSFSSSILYILFIIRSNVPVHSCCVLQTGVIVANHGLSLVITGGIGTRFCCAYYCACKLYLFVSICSNKSLQRVLIP